MLFMLVKEGRGVGKQPGTVRGYAAMTKGRELEQFTYEPPPLGDHDVRLSVTHCGLCYTDVLGIDDFWGITPFPFVPGHEIVGHVTETGPAVIGFEEGDRVGVGWQGRSCGRCEWCLEGEEHLCTEVADNAAWSPYGGISTSFSVDDRFAYHLPEAMPSEAAAVLMCAGLTVYSPLRTYGMGPVHRVGVVGVGGLGHLAIQFARALGCDVTAISSSPGKEEEARALGADHFILAGDREALMSQELTFDMLLYTSHADANWTPLVLSLRNKGRLVLVGFPPTDVRFDAMELVIHQVSMTGSLLGSRATMREMLAFAEERGIRPRVELMPMSQVNEAIERMKENRARYRIVLTNDDAP
jgi:uncharacterized zinc-type alcohol dehydrogenase-like protein